MLKSCECESSANGGASLRVGSIVQVKSSDDRKPHNGLTGTIVSIKDGIYQVQLGNTSKIISVQSYGLMPQSLGVCSRTNLRLDSNASGWQYELMTAAKDGNVEHINRLISKGANVNARTCDGRTAISFASQRDDPHLVRFLISAKACVNLRDKTGDTPLILASKSASMQDNSDFRPVLSELIQHGAILSIENSFGKTAFEYIKESAKYVDLFKGTDGPNGHTLLMTASQQGDLGQILQILRDYLAKRISVNYGKEISDVLDLEFLVDGVRAFRCASTDSCVEALEIFKNDSFTTVMLAAHLGDFDLLKQCCKHRDSINEYTKDGTTALCIAVSNEHPNSNSLVQQLLEAGADPFLSHNKKRCPFISSCLYGFLDISRLFMSTIKPTEFSEINIISNDGQSIWTSKSAAGSSSFIRGMMEDNLEGTEIKLCHESCSLQELHRAFEYLEICEKLEVCGAEPAEIRKYGEHFLEQLENKDTALRLLRLASFLEIIPFCHLLSTFPNILLAASKISCDKCMPALLSECRVNPNGTDSSGNAALHFASDGAAVKLLVEAMADPLLRNQNGETPLHSATKSGSIEVIKALSQYYVTNLDKGSFVQISGLKKAAQYNGMLAILESNLDSHGRAQVKLKLGGKEEILSVKRENFRSMINIGDSGLQSPLNLAAKTNSLKVVQMLITQRADCNLADSNGFTPLHNAVKENHCQMVRLLLEARADATIDNSCGHSPLKYAANKVCSCSELLKTAGADGWTELMLAAERSDLERVKVLIYDGADVTAQNRDHKTALDYARSARGDSAAACYKEIKLATLSQKEISDGWTPVMDAARRNDFSRLKLWIDIGKIDIHQKNRFGKNALYYATCINCKHLLQRAGVDGWTPLMLAAANNDEVLVRQLLSQGVPITLRNVHDMSAFDYATAKTIKQLLKHERAQNWTGLMIAAKEGNLNRVSQLIEWGADVNEKDANGQAAIDHASNVEIKNFLKSKGADGWTLLMIAAEKGDLSEVRNQLDNGADVRAKNKFGKTALHYAKLTDTSEGSACQRLIQAKLASYAKK